MAFLFVVENNVAKPNTETLLIPPFKDIWERDKSEEKTVSINEFTYIELMTSKKKSNPFSGYSDDVRHEKLCEMIFEDVDWKPDVLVEKALIKMRVFHEEASPTYQYYVDNLITAENTRTFLKNIDLNERNEKTGNPLYKPKDVTSAIADTEKVIQTLDLLRDKVEQELFETVKTRSNRQINPFEI